jgi:hypothetical protein
VQCIKIFVAGFRVSKSRSNGAAGAGPRGLKRPLAFGGLCLTCLGVNVGGTRRRTPTCAEATMIRFAATRTPKFL